MIKSFCLAPMEGITGYVFRNAFHQCFRGVTHYMSPFISPGHGGIGITKRDRRDILPENNAGIPLVPQILTNRAEDFLHTAQLLKDCGYREFNLNLGCPSGTVAAKNKGAGFLSELDALDEFFDELFEKLDPELTVSVKTRIGRCDPDEFPALMEIYNRYPISELTIHPRVQKEFYRGHVHMDAFAYAVRVARMPLCYNGDILDIEDIQRIEEQFPSVERMMLGRGLLRDPLLAEAWFAGGYPEDSRERLCRFHDCLLQSYSRSFQFENATLCRMKELWFYLGARFPGCERELKKIKKSRTLTEYQQWAEKICRDFL